MKLIITDVENLDLPIEGDHKVIMPRNPIRHCVGCFGCWIKTPGICLIHDGYERTGIEMGKCTELILISRCCYGSVSPFVKMVLERALSYIHPNFVIRNREMHHKRRYQNVIALSAHLYGENISSIEKETAEHLIEANAVNYDGFVKEIHFYRSVEEMENVIL